MRQKSEAIDVLPHAYLTVSIIEELLGQLGSSEKVTLEEATKWVYETIEELYTNAMEWCGHSDQSSNAIIRLIKAKTGIDIDGEKAEDFIVALDPVMLMLYDDLEHVLSNRWWCYDIRLVNDTVLFISINDYRIIRYNEEIEAGNIDP